MVSQIRNKLRVRQRLIRPAHNPKTNVQIVFLHNARNNRVKRALARRERIRRRLVEAETRAAVVQMKAQAIHHHPRRPSPRNALNPGSNVALLIHHRKVRRIARGGRLPRRHRAVGHRRINQPRPLRRVRLGDHAGRGNLHHARIRDVLQIGVGQLHRLNLAVELGGRKRSRRPKRLENVQHRQRRQPLPVRRQLMHPPAPVCRRQRRHPFRLESRQISRREQPAQPLRLPYNGRPDLTRVEHIGALFGDQLHGAAQVRILPPLSHRRRLPVRIEDANALRVLPHQRRLPTPPDHLLDRKAFPRQANRRCKQRLPRQLAVPLVHRLPTPHTPRHRHRMNPRRVHLLEALRLQRRDGHRLRGGPGGVEAGDLAGLGVAVHHKQIAANAAHHRLHQTQDGVGGNRRIDGVTPLPEDLGAGLRSQHLASSDDAASGNHHRPAMRTIARLRGGQTGEEEKRQAESEHTEGS